MKVQGYILCAALVAISMVALLSGCATDQGSTRIQTQIVEVAVPTPCVSDKVPASSAYPDTDAALLAAADAAERYHLVAIGRALRKARLELVEPIIEGCRK